MKEVFKSNFEELLPKIKSEIKNASFIAIDTEFTGLNTSSDKSFSLFDSMPTRYLKLKDFASNFVICQFGMTLFKKYDNVSYSANTYTFYLCPHQCGSNDRRILWQVSAIHFLTRHNFDFNKFAYEGIPYLNEAELEIAKSEIKNGTFCTHHFGSLENRRYDEKLLDFEAKAKVGEEIVIEQDKCEHEYFQLKFLRLMYPKTWSVVENNRILMQKVSKSQRQNLEKEVIKEEEKLLEFYLGFSHIFNELKESKKPLVGHNCLLDLLLMYNSFFNPLPETLEKFKENINTVFPSVYDTKHIWLNMKRFYNLRNITRESELHFLYKILQTPPDGMVTLFSPTIISVSKDNFAQESLKHNAGYDSYVCGCVFIKLCHIFAMNKTRSLVEIVPQTFKQHMKAVEPFKNKVNIAIAKVHYLNLSGSDTTSRPEMLYVKLKNKHSFNMNEIAHKIGGYGYVEIQQFSPSEALVAVSSFGCAKDILNGLKEDKEILVVQYSYAKHYLFPKCKFWIMCLGIPSIVSYVVYRFLKK